jgi:hypothetical protein
VSGNATVRSEELKISSRTGRWRLSPARWGRFRFGGLVGEVEHAQLHGPRSGRGVLGGVAVLVEQGHVVVEERVEAFGGVVAARAGGFGPRAVLANVADEPVDQVELAGDLRGAPFVEGGPVVWAEAVVVGLAQVRRDGAPPAFPAVGLLWYLLDDSGVSEDPQVVAGAAGVLAERLGQGG